MDSRKAFENNLNSLVTKAGWNQTDLGEKLGLSQVQARNYLKGKSSPPFDILDKIASTFGINVSDLFKENVVPKPNIIKPTPEEALSILTNALHQLHAYEKMNELFQNASTLSETQKDELIKAWQAKAMEILNKKKKSSG